MARYRHILALGAALVLAPLAASADGISVGGTDEAQLALGAGGYDVLHNYTAGLFDAEYRFGTRIWFLRPFVGGEATTDGSVYGYGGFGVELVMGDWVVTPNTAVGLWSRGDKSAKNLGATVEFRSGFDIDYELPGESRIGLSLHHISNAGIGKANPGEEEALVVWSLPLGTLMP